MLKFASRKEALQHLSNLTGKRVKIAKATSEIYDYMDDKISFGLAFTSDIGKNININEISKESEKLNTEAENKYEKAIEMLEAEEVPFDLLDQDKVGFYIDSKGSSILLSTDSGFGFAFKDEEDMSQAKVILKNL